MFILYFSNLFTGDIEKENGQTPPSVYGGELPAIQDATHDEKPFFKPGYTL